VAKMTLLEMTQDILSAMTSDSVNSISDTEESLMVADRIRTTFYFLMTKRDWPFLLTYTTLTALGDTSNPTKMQIPETLNKVFWIRYNGKQVTYMPPLEFTERIESRNAQTGVIDSSGYGLNADPLYWTTYDDKYLFFDSRDEGVDTTLQASKSKVYGVKLASWTHTDSFIPDIPEKFFPTLLAEAKSSCFVELKQQPNVKEEARSKLGQVQLQKEAWRINDGEHKTNIAVNYGRR
jgi:hypothetical protein